MGSHLGCSIIPGGMSPGILGGIPYGIGGIPPGILGGIPYEYVNTYLIGSSLSGLFRVNWNLEMLVFEERGKPEYPEKNLSEQGREPTTNSTHI